MLRCQQNGARAGFQFVGDIKEKKELMILLAEDRAGAGITKDVEHYIWTDG
jgi:hypothetical protein